MSQLPPALPEASTPRHVAIIMDGNGRWAQQRGRPRAVGHRAGVRAVRSAIRGAMRRGVEVITLFAFSQENWRRPELEVRVLMQLFISTLAREVRSMHRNGIRIRFIGDHRNLSPELRQAMAEAEALTACNARLQLVVAVDYGGQWDIVQAARRLAERGQAITAESLDGALSTAGLPDPDLLIRTGGERRISNFLLWQIAYCELYFTPLLWPDFDESAFDAALDWFAGRERRFGRVPEAH